jgi:ferredoxin
LKTIFFLCALGELCGYITVSFRYGGLMRATVDPNRCDIAGICVVICPEVFRFHEGSKKAYVTRVEIPKNLEQKCLEAAKKCPNKAIIILRD